MPQVICSTSVVRAALVWRSWSSPERGFLKIPERGLEMPDPSGAGLSHSPCSTSSEPSSCSSPCSSSKCGHQDCWFWDAAFWVAAASFPTGHPARDRFRPILILFFDQTGKLAWSCPPPSPAHQGAQGIQLLGPDFVLGWAPACTFCLSPAGMV